MLSKIKSLLIAFIVLFGCSSEKEDKQVSTDDLLGSWKLIKYVDHANGATGWTSYSNDYIYQKHITPTHFTWLKYAKSTDELEGIGGGTYSYSDNTYTEDIAFFLPAGSSELGQAIPFDVEIDPKGFWHHNGYAKRFEFDVDNGEMVVVDSVQIEEIWEKVSPEGGNNNIMGTWNLEAYRSMKSDSLMSEYPPFVEYMKLITPSHFVWVKYNGEGDEVMAAASGTYEYKSGVYTENIETSYPEGTGIVGTGPEFDADVKGNIWHHLGQIYRLDSAGGEPTTSLIDEIWMKVEE